MTNAFAIILPEYLIRCDAECGTVFEKIESNIRPARPPLLYYNHDEDEETKFERILTKIQPVPIKIKTRKLKTRELPTKITAEIVGQKNIVMNDIHGVRIRVIATIKKGGDDNPLANVINYQATKCDKSISKLKLAPKVAIPETWEDQFGNKIVLTDDLKKLKATTEEAIRKEEDKRVVEKRMKQIASMTAISRQEAEYKKELLKDKMKSEAKRMHRNKLLEMLKACKEEEFAVQYTQWSKAKEAEKIIEKSPVVSVYQQLQTATVKQSEIKDKDNMKNQSKISQEDMDNDEAVLSEYLPTATDYYLRGQLVSRPSTDKR
uniref:Uncharacterized protein n=1 Tax=Setaria digitata TaxID=48799 RepID=A0A915Q2G0_9BILA